MQAKLSEQLDQLIQSTEASDLIEVIVELYPSNEPEAVGETRSERIAQSKAAFSRKIAPLEETIKSIGGEITGEAWINETIRARVPANKVSLLCDHDEVAKLDVPHQLVPDAIK